MELDAVDDQPDAVFHSDEHNLDARYSSRMEYRRKRSEIIENRQPGKLLTRLRFDSMSSSYQYRSGTRVQGRMNVPRCITDHQDLLGCQTKQSTKIIDHSGLRLPTKTRIVRTVRTIADQIDPPAGRPHEAEELSMNCRQISAGQLPSCDTGLIGADGDVHGPSGKCGDTINGPINGYPLVWRLDEGR